MVTRKRRIIDDDDEDGSKLDNDGQMNSQAEENRSAATSMVDRLKRRAAKSAELAQKNKQKKEAEYNDTIPSSSEKSSTSNKAAQNQQSIPKKAKITQSIPKKANDDKNGSIKDEDKVKKDTPSLLSGMKKPPIPKLNVSKSTSGGARGVQSNGNRGKPFHSVTPKQLPDFSSRSSSAIASTPPPVNPNSTAIPSQQAESDASRTTSNEGDRDKFGSGLRQLVFDGLKDLCKDAFENPPERQGVDLFASFLRHKDLNPISSINEDNTSDNLQYDFFDVDDTTGTIILQPKIPIFPEDFPAGAKEWPLSWWGIVEPSIEEKKREEKKERKSNPDEESPSRARHDRSSARSESGMQASGDRYRRDISRNTRKRSSRDRYEDEYPYYDDYPRWEDRRDRFPDGPPMDGNGSGHPPHHRGEDFEYDYDPNRRSPTRYPGSRDPQHRGGGQPFPDPMRDGPHSRPYPRGAPPPRDYREGDFRDGDYRDGDYRDRDYRDGGRPYPPHGGGGTPPWDYPHRDPHGPVGRGPPPQRDDRRDYRERLHRSERDDGRHSVRNPSSRRDRTRSSR